MVLTGHTQGSPARSAPTATCLLRPFPSICVITLSLNLCDMMGGGGGDLQRLARAGALQRSAQVRLGGQLERRAQAAAQRARAHCRRQALAARRWLPRMGAGRAVSKYVLGHACDAARRGASHNTRLHVKPAEQASSSLVLLAS